MPFQPECVVLVNSREVRDILPKRLLRRNKNSAIFEFDIPRRTYLSLRDVEKELRQGSIIELWYGIGTAQQRIFYGYLPSVSSDRNLSSSRDIISLIAYDFIGQLQDSAIKVASKDAPKGTVFESSTGTGGSGGGESGGDPPPPPPGGGGGDGGIGHI